MSNNNNDVLFFKVFRNKYLLNIILKFLNTLNTFNCFNDDQNNLINEIFIKKVRKYDNIISVDWMIKNNLFGLLKYKLNDKQSYDKLQFNNKTIERFCKTFSENSQVNTLQLFKEIYSKISHYFIDESTSVLLLFIIGKRLDIAQFLLSTNSYHQLYKLNINHLMMAINDYEMLNYLLNDFQLQDEKLKLEFYKRFLPLVSSMGITVKNNIEMALNIYLSTMDQDSGENKLLNLGESIYNLAIIGDYEIFIKYSIITGFYSEELFIKLIYKLLFQLAEIKRKSLLLGHLLILEYIRKKIITKLNENYLTPNVETNVKPKSSFFNDPIYVIAKKATNYEFISELLDNDCKPLPVQLESEKDIFRFFINYFQESITSTFRYQNSNETNLDHFNSKLYYLKKAIDLDDLKSLKFLIVLFSTSSLVPSKDVLYSKSLEYVLDIYTTNIEFTQEREDLLNYLITNVCSSGFKLSEPQMIGLYSNNNIKLLGWLWNNHGCKFSSRNPLYYAIKYSNDYSFIKSIYYDLNIRIDVLATGIVVLVIKCDTDYENLYNIIKFIYENVIRPAPMDFTFESVIISKLIPIEKKDFKIIKYLIQDSGYMFTNRLLIRFKETTMNYCRIDIYEYLKEHFIQIKNRNTDNHQEYIYNETFFLNVQYFKNALNDQVIRYILSKKNNENHLSMFPIDDMLLETNNIELYKLSSHYVNCLPNNSNIVKSISYGHLEITKFLIEDLFKRSTPKLNRPLEKVKTLFKFLERSIESRVLGLIKLILSMVNKEMENGVTLSVEQIKICVNKSISSKDFEIFKFIIDTFNIDNVNNSNYRFDKLTKSMSIYLDKQ